MIIVAGPCAAENREQTLETAKQLAALGVRFYRAGVWKPRSRPGSFEGVGEEALSWLSEARRLYGVEPATEVASAEHVRLCLQYGIRTLWIGARTTTNPFLVQQIADALAEYNPDTLEPLDTLESLESLESLEHLESLENPENRPALTILVKNPLSPDVALWQGAVQRLEQAVGQGHVIAVHRGFQTGETGPYRNTPDWSVIFELRSRMPHLKMLLDASHMAGQRDLVTKLCLQAVELTYDGLMLECHICPDEALSDANQQITPDQLRELMAALPTHRQGDSTDTELAFLRHEIDEVDDKLWQLIANRLELSHRIGEYKRSHHMQVFQQDRYSAVLARRLAWAKEMNISEEWVTDLMNLIHEMSCKKQL